MGKGFSMGRKVWALTASVTLMIEDTDALKSSVEVIYGKRQTTDRTESR